jgi:methylthioribose-1-phosphate isomerase
VKPYCSVQWLGSALRLIDQRLLPHQTRYLSLTDYREVAGAIHDMIVRGAPAIGAAAAYGLALCAVHSAAGSVNALRAELQEAAAVLRASRPTAVNLFWATDRMMALVADSACETVEGLRQAVVAEANAIADDDVATNRQIGMHALPLIPDKANIIHHCNTGALATMDYGTALGIIRTAHEHGKQVHVFVDETRPRLQGARLTTWELQQLGIPNTLIVDGASGHVMRTIGVDCVTVGCDRVAANGDTANKIGTYNLALAAHAHGVPFYVAAPASTIDMAIATGDEIAIEEREASEVTHMGETQLAPDDVKVFNPAFDVTPGRYITAIITEMGIAYPPFAESLPVLMAKAKGRKQ